MEAYDFLRARRFRVLSLRDGFRGKDREVLQGDAWFARSLPAPLKSGFHQVGRRQAHVDHLHVA